MRTIDQTLLDQLSLQAAASPRLRKNLNIHPSDDSRCHKLFNAMEPTSYIRPHRHLDPEKDETFLIIRGRIGIVRFDDGGGVAEVTSLEPDGTITVDIPHGTFHTAISLAPGTIFFEAKGGPYRPLTEPELAAWAPAEGTPEAAGYLGRLVGLFRQ